MRNQAFYDNLIDLFFLAKTAKRIKKRPSSLQDLQVLIKLLRNKSMNQNDQSLNISSQLQDDLLQILDNRDELGTLGFTGSTFLAHGGSS